MSKRQKQLRQERQVQLLHEFDHQESDHYEERKVGNEWLIKMWNGGTKKWQVAVYSEESYRRYTTYNENKNELDYKINKDD